VVAEPEETGECQGRFRAEAAGGGGVAEEYWVGGEVCGFGGGAGVGGEHGAAEGGSVWGGADEVAGGGGDGDGLEGGADGWVGGGFCEDVEGEAAPFCGVLFDAVAVDERVKRAGGGEDAAAAVVENDGAQAFEPEVEDEDHYWSDDEK
jgi:hypothetical protein